MRASALTRVQFLSAGHFVGAAERRSNAVASSGDSDLIQRFLIT
jgi:hypothetical protein